MKLFYFTAIAVFTFVLFTGCIKLPVKARKENSTAVQIFSEQPPQRIIALSPAAAEILCAVGAYDQIAARTDNCDYPPEIRNLPSAGGFNEKSITIEKLLSFEPDLVYGTCGIHDITAKQLKKHGIKVFLSDIQCGKDIFTEINEIGKITGHEEEAKKEIREFKNRIKTISAAYQEKERPRVYWEVWDEPYGSVGKKSLINEIIKIAGGENIFKDIPQEYPVVSEEAIIARAPDIIIIQDSDIEAVETIKKRAGWQTVPAVINGRIYSVDSNFAVHPGLRITETAESIAELLHSME